jgi:hypothetical protein
MATAEISDHAATGKTNAVSDSPAPESMEAVLDTAAAAPDAVSETIQHPHHESTEAATADAEHSEQAKAESAS